MGFEEFDRLASGGAAPLESDTAKLKAQFTPPPEPIGQAVESDLSGLASLDPTNPSNVMGLVRHGVPMAIQAGVTALAPEAGLLTKMGLGGAGSVLASLFSGGENVVEGKPSGITPKGLLASLGIGAGSEALVGGAGALGRAAVGKSAALEAGATAEREAAETLRDKTAKAATEALAERESAAEKAGSAAVKGQQKALGEVEKARTALADAKAEAEAQVQLHTEGALQSVQDSVIERQISAGIGVPTTRPPELTLEQLSKRTSPVLHSTQRAIGGVFKGISEKFEQNLDPYRELGVENTLPEVIGAERAWLASENKQVSPAMVARMKRYEQQGETGASSVGGHLGMRSELVGVMRKTGSSPLDKRVAGRMIEAIDENIGGAVPPEFEGRMTELRDEWRTANSMFSGQFRSKLFKSTTPGEVADTLYGAASGADAHQAALVVRQMRSDAPDELPLLRSAFAERAAADPVGVTSKMDPVVFRELYGGTGFADPKAWADAIRGQTTLAKVMEDPQLSAKLQLAMQKGAKSFGVQKYERALRTAEDQLRKVPDPVTAIHDALRDLPTPEKATDLTRAALPDPAAAGKAATIESARKPWGSHFTHYVKNRFLYHTVMGAALYGASGLTHHPMAMLAPLAYLGSSKIWGAALGTERGARLYYNAITSKTAESMGFYFGRLAAATLTEGVKSSADE